MQLWAEYNRRCLGFEVGSQLDGEEEETINCIAVKLNITAAANQQLI